MLFMIINHAKQHVRHRPFDNQGGVGFWVLKILFFSCLFAIILVFSALRAPKLFIFAIKLFFSIFTIQVFGADTAIIYFFSSEWPQNYFFSPTWSRNYFFSQIWARNYFFSKKTYPPWISNGRWLTSFILIF